jgi:hypothetical protein
MKWGLIASLVIALLAIVSVFVEIPIVSNYAFWVLFSSWLLNGDDRFPSSDRHIRSASVRPHQATPPLDRQGYRIWRNRGKSEQSTRSNCSSCPRLPAFAQELRRA